MSEEKDIREDLKPSYEDYTHAGVKAGLSFVPIIGAPISEFFSMVIAPPLEKRRDVWMTMIHQELLRLETVIEGFRIENIKDNEQFISVLLYATNVVMRTHQKEKIEALRNAVINSLDSSSLEESYNIIFLNLIDRYTTWHLTLLQKMNAFYPPNIHEIQALIVKGSKATNFTVKSDIGSIFPELQDYPELSKKIENDLVVDGLIFDGHFSKDAFDHTNNRRRTTRFGQDFLKFIQDFYDDE